MTQEAIISFCFVIVMSTPFLFAYVWKLFSNRDGLWHLHKRFLPTMIRTVDGRKTRELEVFRRRVGRRWQYRLQTDTEDADTRFSEAW